MHLVEKNKYLTFAEGTNILVLCDGREVAKAGFFSPVAYRKAYKMYHAIVSEAQG